MRIIQKVIKSPLGKALVYTQKLQKLVSNEPGVRFVDDHIISIEGSTSKKAAYEKVVGVGAIDINGDVAEFSAIEGIPKQRYGTLSGTVRKFQFYLYSKYEGTKTVERIKASWTVTAKMRSQATLTLSTSLSTNSATISAGTSSTWQNVSLNKYYISTNGTKMVYDQSNFTCAPDSDLYSYEVSLVTESSVKLKSDAKTYTISSGC